MRCWCVFVVLLFCCSKSTVSSFSFTPQRAAFRLPRTTSSVKSLRQQQHGLKSSDNDNNDNGDWNPKSMLSSSNISINPMYLGLATAETIFWYYLAPGIDPNSRWFAPADGVLLSQLLDPTVVLSQPGYAFSSLLLNCFLLLPMVWTILLLQEEEDQVITPLPFCLAGFFVGGGALIPYMIIRRVPDDVDSDRSKFSAFLQLFEPSAIGPKLLGLLTTIVLTTFALEIYNSNLEIEWNAFVDRLFQSQFVSLALFDFTMLSCTIVDPMTDDAKRRGYLYPDSRTSLLAPFLVPLIGPVAWILKRPGLDR